MKKRPAKSARTELRRQAEVNPNERAQQATAATGTGAGTRRLVQELQVHQTELERQNQELARSRAEGEALLCQYTDLYDLAPVGYFSLARDGAIHQVNLVGANLLGMEREALIKRRFELFVFIGSRPAFSAFLQKVFSTSGSKETCEVALQKDKTGPIWVCIEGTRSVDGLESHIVVVNITERRRAEISLRESEERYRAIIDNSADLIQSVGFDGRFLFVNPKWRQTFGYSEEEVAGLNLLDVVHPDFHQECREMSEKVINGITVPRFEVTCIARDGRLILLEGSATPQVLDDQVIAAQSFLRDITERKQAQEALRQSEGRFKDIFQTVDEGIVYASLTGNIIDVNDALVHISGIPREELIGRNVISLLHKLLTIKEAARIAPIVTRAIKEHVMTLFQMEYHNNVLEISAHLSAHSQNLIGILRDITERVSAEKAIKQAHEAEQLLAHTVRSIEECISITDLDDRFTFVNQAFLNKYGYSYEEIIGQPVGIIVSPNNAPEFIKEVLEHSRRDGWRGEILDLTKDGREFPISLRTSHITNEKGEIIGLVGVAEDITERKQAEDTILKERTLLRTLIDNLPNGIFVKDKEYRKIIANPIHTEGVLGHLKYLGMNSEIDIINKTDFEVFPKELAEKFFSADQTVIRDGDSIINNVEFGFQSDGKKIWFLTSKVPLRDKDGSIVGMIGITNDITERKLAEEALLESELRYQTLAEVSPVGIFRTDSEGFTTYVNKRWCEISGLSAEKAQGYGWLNAVHPDDREKLSRNWLEAVQVHSDSRKDYRFLKPDGSITWVIGQAVPEKDESGRIFSYVGTITDITERKRMEIEKEILETQLRRSQKLESIGTLDSGIAHDFNNILGIIIGHTSLLKSHLTDPAKFDFHLTTIDNAAQRGANLVKQMLSFARKDEPFITPVDLNEIITEVVNFLHETFPKTILVHTEQSASLSLILADATQIHQMILNLGLNARDAMPDGGELQITTSLTTGPVTRKKHPDADAADYISITVQDTGSGLDPQTLERIFDPFFTTKDVGKGTGLGLAQVHGIVSTHRGFIDVNSALGAGTTFQIYLPVPATLPGVAHPFLVQKAKIAGGTETILVIEDEEMLRNLLNVILKRKGYRPLFAQDGKAGVELFRQHQAEIALVLTDMGLPLISGVEVFRRIREIDPQVKVIMASGFIDPDMKSELFKAGLKSFIQKPYSPDEVLSRVRQVINTNG